MDKWLQNCISTLILTLTYDLRSESCSEITCCPSKYFDYKMFMQYAYWWIYGSQIVLLPIFGLAATRTFDITTSFVQMRFFVITSISFVMDRCTDGQTNGQTN